MIIVMSPTSTKENLEKVEQKITRAGLKYHLSEGDERTIVGVIGDKKIIAGLQMNSLDGVEKTVRITEKYKLVSREFKPEDTVIEEATTLQRDGLVYISTVGFSDDPAQWSMQLQPKAYEHVAQGVA